MQQEIDDEVFILETEYFYRDFTPENVCNAQKKIQRLRFNITPMKTILIGHVKRWLRCLTYFHHGF